MPDNDDGQPLDGSTAEAGVKPDEPEVAVDKTEVILTKDDLVKTVKVTNSGAGTLTWTAAIDNGAVAVISPNAPDLQNGDGILFINVPMDYDFTSTPPAPATVKITDTTGATKDYKEITVKVMSGDLPPISIQLNQGWNLISSWIDPIDSSAGTVLSDIGDNIASVWKWVENNWAVYLPGVSDGGLAYSESKGFKLLDNINSGEGFWVNSLEVIILD